MPTYQYACTNCDNRFEQVQAFTDEALTQCPVCSGRLRKLYGAVGVVFKGSGFYRNDSRTGSSGSSSTGSSSSSSSAASTSSGASSSESTSTSATPSTGSTATAGSSTS